MPTTGSVNFIPNRKLVVIYFLLCIRVCQIDAGLSQVLDLKEMNRCYYHVFRRILEKQNTTKLRYNDLVMNVRLRWFALMTFVVQWYKITLQNYLT